MWYVIWVFDGQEGLIKDWVDKTGLASESFIPIRERRKKYYGSWNLEREIVFPGYVFVVCENPAKLSAELKKIPKFTKMLGKTDDEIFIPLSEEDVRLISRFGDEDHVSHLSKVAVEEGNKVKIISGDLLNYEGKIVRIDLHKRIAIVRIEFMGKEVDVYLGIDVVSPID